MIEQLETIALKSIALKDMEYFHRKVCRYYSHNFHTPLTEVLELPWPFVLSNYLEHVIETNHGQEGVYDLAIDICCPEKRAGDEETLQQRIREIEEEEENKRIEADKKRLILKDEEKEINMEASSFSHLEEEMGEE